MAIEKNTIGMVNKCKLGVEQISAECSVNLDEQVSKLLSYCVYPIVENIEVLMGEVNVVGKLAVKLVYMTTENQILCRDTTCDFSSKYSNNSIDPSNKVNVCSKLIDANAVVLSENNIKITSVIELQYTLIKQEDLSVLCGGDETLCLSSTEMKVTSLACCENQDFEEEINVQLKEKFEKIISVDSDIIIKDTLQGVNFVSITGEIITKIMLLSDSETGKITTLTNNETFKRELEATGVNQESQIDISLQVRKDLMKYEVVEQDGASILKLNIPSKVEIYAYDQSYVSCTEDIYSLTNNIEIVTESFKRLNFGELEYFESKIEGSLTLSETQPRVDKILAISSPYVLSTNSYIKEGEVFVEGVAYTNVIYLNDEEMTTNSIQVEVPFTISEKTSNKEGCEIEVNQLIDDVDVIVKRGRELYFDAKIKANVKCYTEETDAVITDIAIGEDLPERDCAIEIYFGKEGDKLWDIAKSLNISLDVLKEQNVTAPDILENNTNLTIYYQKNK